jgi:hypothetical protein
LSFLRVFFSSFLLSTWLLIQHVTYFANEKRHCNFRN